MKDEKPLAGKRILIPRAKTQTEIFSNQIRMLGGMPIVLPLIKIVPPKDKSSLILAVKQIHTFDWLVFTSQNGVDAFFSIVHQENVPSNWTNKVKIAVVGTKTNERLRKYGCRADIVPTGDYTAESLVEELLVNVQKDERVLFARGNLARDVLPQSLRQHGIEVVDVVAYETTMNKNVQPQLMEEVESQRLDVIAFTSPSTVRSFMSMLERVDWRSLLKNTCLAAIGPITKQSMIQHGLYPDVVAKLNTTEGLLAELVDFFQRSKQKEE